MRCKFKVTQITRSMGSMPGPDKNAQGYPIYVPTEMWSVTMSPVYGNGDPNHENTKFWQASPSGEFKLTTVNKSAVDALRLDGEYYIDITSA